MFRKGGAISHVDPGPVPALNGPDKTAATTSFFNPGQRVVDVPAFLQTSNRILQCSLTPCPYAYFLTSKVSVP